MKINTILGFLLSALAVYLLLNLIQTSLTVVLVSVLVVSILNAGLWKMLSATFWYHYLKFLTLGLIGAFVVFSFSQVGFNLILQQSISIAIDSIVMSVLFVLALFVYYLLLETEPELNKPNINTLKPSIILCLLVAFALTVLQLLVLRQLELDALEQKILMRGIIPPLSVLLFNWGFLLLLGRLLWLYRSVEAPSFIQSETFYVFPNYLNYALPILGFIGTVLGISLSASGIAEIIASPDGLSSSSQNLGDAIAPLGIAFDTTLVALTLSLMFGLFLVLVESFENKKINGKKTL
jgi:hypothetical protein